MIADTFAFSLRALPAPHRFTNREFSGIYHVLYHMCTQVGRNWHSGCR